MSDILCYHFRIRMSGIYYSPEIAVLNIDLHFLPVHPAFMDFYTGMLL